MAFRLADLMLARVLSWVTLLARTEAAKDVEIQVLATWHERHVTAHLTELTAVESRVGDPAQRLRATLEAYARMSRQRDEHGGNELAAALHRGEPVARLRQQLTDLFTGLITKAAATGAVRTDVPALELAAYSIHALGAAGDATSPAALSRLVDLVWAGLIPPSKLRLAPPQDHAGVEHFDVGGGRHAPSPPTESEARRRRPAVSSVSTPPQQPCAITRDNARNPGYP